MERRGEPLRLESCWVLEYPSYDRIVALSPTGGTGDDFRGAGCGIHHADRVSLREDTPERPQGEEAATLVEASAIVGRGLEVGWLTFKAGGTVVEELAADTAAAQLLQHANVEEVPVLVRGAILEQV